MNKVESALAQKGLRFIGGFRTRDPSMQNNKYLPHQGKKERERALKAAAKRAGEVSK